MSANQPYDRFGNVYDIPRVLRDDDRFDETAYNAYSPLYLPATYAVTCRGRKVGNVPRFESWAYPLIVGQPLPTLPLWLTEDLAVSLDLEASYEDTCRVFRIP